MFAQTQTYKYLNVQTKVNNHTDINVQVHDQTDVNVQVHERTDKTYKYKTARLHIHGYNRRYHAIISTIF